MRISDWSSDVCSSDLAEHNEAHLDYPGAMFETFGFQYSGPIDGHALPVLMTEFERLKDAKGPQLLHVVTTKGKGFGPAESDPIKYHEIGRSSCRERVWLYV